MNIVNGEEKKEGGEDIGAPANNCFCDDNDASDVEELMDLPPEIAERIGRERCFETEESLVEALVEAGVGDLPVVLVEGKPQLIVPSDQHNVFTRKYDKHFEKKWAKDRWGTSSATHKIHLTNGRSRDPDLSFWGYPRCIRNGDKNLEPAVKGSVPDVIFQFSWQNKAQYEEDAINDIMKRSLEKTWHLIRNLSNSGLPHQSAILQKKNFARCNQELQDTRHGRSRYL